MYFTELKDQNTHYNLIQSANILAGVLTDSLDEQFYTHFRSFKTM